MKINFTKNQEVLTVALDGRLDTTTAPELEKFLTENYIISYFNINSRAHSRGFKNFKLIYFLYLKKNE